MRNVVIVGGGISGLLCATIFSKYPNVNVEVIESGEIGGEFLTGGLKYVHRTTAMEDFLTQQHVFWSGYFTKGGILLRGVVEKYPLYLKSLSESESTRIRHDHYKKTRLMAPTEFGANAMNDPVNAQSNSAIRCDFGLLIRKMASNPKISITRASAFRILGNRIFLSNGSIKIFDNLVLTIPLWVIKKISDYEIPDCHAMNLNIAIVKGINGDPYFGWDYVYTPYTPADCIHRFSYGDDGYAVEANGELDENRFHSDLNFIFRDGWSLVSVRKNLKGHLLPIEGKIVVPQDVALLGRFAAWEPRTTVDVTLNRAIELGKRWFE